jgi:hypothetical protein
MSVAESRYSWNITGAYLTLSIYRQEPFLNGRVSTHASKEEMNGLKITLP